MSIKKKTQINLLKYTFLVLFVVASFFIGGNKVEAWYMIPDWVDLMNRYNPSAVTTPPVQKAISGTVFTSNGSWTVPAGVTSATVQVIGGGGGGGGFSQPGVGDGDNHSGGAGGSGGNTTQTVSVSPGQTISIVVGSGGSAGGFWFNSNTLCAGGTGNRNGTSGKASSFGSISSGGGGGGTGSGPGDNCSGSSGAGGSPGGSPGGSINCNRNSYGPTSGGSNGSGYGSGGNSNGISGNNVTCPTAGGSGAVIVDYAVNGACGSTYQSCKAGTLGSSKVYQPNEVSPPTPPHADWWCNGSGAGATNILCVEYAYCGGDFLYTNRKTYAASVTSYQEPQCLPGYRTDDTTAGFPAPGGSAAWLCQLPDSSGLYSRMCRVWRDPVPVVKLQFSLLEKMKSSLEKILSSI